METSNHEEADTRIILHLIDSLEAGATEIEIVTVDSDVIIILMSFFFNYTTSMVISTYSLLSTLAGLLDYII